MAEPAVPRIVAATAAITVLLILASAAAWRLYGEWRLGRVELTTAGPPLVLQVLDESGEELIGEPVDLVKKTTLSLPDGDYRLRATAVGRLGRTFCLAVNRGETIAHDVSLDEGRLLGGEPGPLMGMQEKPQELPMPFAGLTVAMELAPGKADLVEWTGDALVRRDGSTGKAVWDTSRPKLPYDPGRDPAAWLRHAPRNPWQIQLVENVPDLDNDGTRDLLLSFWDSTAFLALSGKDGSILWTYATALDGPGGPQPEGPDLPGPIRPASRPGQVLGTPVMGDADGDGTLDLIATLVFREFPAEVASRARGKPTSAISNTPIGYQWRVVAISGRSGRLLWSHPVDRNWTFEPSGFPSWISPARVVEGRNSALVAVVDQTRWTGLGLATGRRVATPIDLGFFPSRPIQYADLDGDGEPEILALGTNQRTGQQSLVAFSWVAGRELWATPMTSSYAPSQQVGPLPNWPMVVDLDGDGRSEILVPYSTPSTQPDALRGLLMLEGSSGRTRWGRPMRPRTTSDDGLAQILDAPDLDRDGTRDLILVSDFRGHLPAASPRNRPAKRQRVYVDALSGKDGRPLWFWHADADEERIARIWTSRWWGLGPDGWPLLTVTLGGRHPQGIEMSWPLSRLHPPMTHVLEASSGREVHEVLGLTRTEAADLDGDGITDLWGEADGQLRAFRGETPEHWRALGIYHRAGETTPRTGEFVHPGVDLDGDGIADALIGNLRVPGAWNLTTGSRTAVARSGRDGHLLWKTVLDPPRIWYERDHGDSFSLTTSPLPDGDLDGDGTPDVIVQKHEFQPGSEDIRRAAALPLEALSGRSGRRLWSAGPLPLGFEAYGHSRIQWIDIRSVEPKAPPDVLISHDSPFLKASPAPPSSNTPGQPRLARLSGRDGHVVWDIALTDPGAPAQWGQVSPPQFGDLDGDGALDVAMIVSPPPTSEGPQYELMAVSLRDGRRLWSRRIDDKSNTFATGGPRTAISDLDGDHRPEVLVTERPEWGAGFAFEFKTLDGRSGTPRWNWRPAAAVGNSQMPGWISPTDFGGNATDTVYVSYGDLNADNWIVALDGQGRETARRRAPGGLQFFPRPVDLDGDGREELLLEYDYRLHTWGRDLKERWSWPDHNGFSKIVLAGDSRQPATIVVYPCIGLDGAAGHPRWASLAPQHGWWTNYRPALLDPGGIGQSPLVLSSGAGATACRSALPTTPKGSFILPPGMRVRPGLARNDPRWTRPLPWIAPTVQTVGPMDVLALFGLATFNVGVPIVILWLAARRRRWTMRTLMALPVAAAMPLSAFLTVEPLMPAQAAPLPPNHKLLFALATLAGIPVLTFMAITGWSLVRLRWKPIARLAGLTVLASAVIAVAWLWADSRAMPAVEHYGRSGWLLVVLPGAYAAGLLTLIGWMLRGTYRWLRRPPRLETSIP